MPGRAASSCLSAWLTVSFGMPASMSRSSPTAPVASMTCSYAAASADAPEHVDSRYGPLAPPEDTITLPPAALSALISPMIRESVSPIVPPHDGWQPVESASTNASVNAFCPVAFATSTSVGDGYVMSTYGATRALPPPGGVVGDVVGDGEAEVGDAVGVPPPQAAPFTWHPLGVPAPDATNPKLVLAPGASDPL